MQRNRRKGLYANGPNKGRKLTGYEYGDEIEFEIPYRKLGQHHVEDNIDARRDVQSWSCTTEKNTR